MYYLFDGSWCGLLSVLFEIRQSGEPAESLVLERPYRIAFWGELARVSSNTGKAFQVAESLRRQLGAENFHRLRLASLSRQADACWQICRFVSELWQGLQGPQLPTELLQMAEEVAAETQAIADRLLFYPMPKNWLYAGFSSQNDTLELLAPIFRQTLGTQRWLIHDLERQRAALCQGQDCLLLDLPLPPEKLQSVPDAAKAGELWQRCFRQGKLPLRGGLSGLSGCGRRAWPFLE